MERVMVDQSKRGEALFRTKWQSEAAHCRGSIPPCLLI